jgi:hypothetical protein
VIDFDALLETSRGNYHSFFIDLVDEVTNTPVNLTGYALEATFRERGTSPLLLTIPAGAKLLVSEPADGRVQLILNEADTQVLPSRDLTYCGCETDPQYTCIAQINGTTGGRRILLATIAIDNISSTVVGGT